MINNIGNYLQISALLFSGLAIVVALFSAYGTRVKYNFLNKLAIIFFSAGMISTLLAFLLLIYAFITSDFSIQNVFLNSSTLKPCIFKIAASWASHEGSMLLWLCLLQVISFIYIILLNYFLHSKNCATEFTTEVELCKKSIESAISIILLSLIQIMFGSFSYFTSNPFTALSFHPTQGVGLNPMLQDIALVFHPPILYLGYVSYVAPFISACMILLLSKVTLTHLKIIKIFANLGILFLTGGIALGSWWAYRELGWGGFWFFDPVENISLLPWLSGIVLYHSAKVSLDSRRMNNWTIYLSILTFLIAIFSTFLVRSGLITSIHSFALSEERAIYLLTIFAVIAVPSILLIIFKHEHYSNNITNAQAQKSIMFQEKLLLIGGSSFLIALIILLYATLYPLAYSLLYHESITVEQRFFINNFIIFIIPTILVAGISVTNKINKNNLISLSCALIITVISAYKISYGWIGAMITIFSLFLIIQTGWSLIEKIVHAHKKINISMLLGHLGFGVLALTITLGSLMQKEIDFIGKIGDQISSEGFEITLRDIRVSKAQNYYRQITEFWVQDQHNNITILKPENRLYIIEKQLSQESNIYSYLTYDLYAVLSKIDDETVHAKIYYKPLMSFMWLAIMLIVGGFGVTLFTFQ